VPVYEYRCFACQKTFNQFSRRIAGDGDALPACPACGKPAQRALSSFAYHRSVQMQLDNLDPRFEREMDAADSMKGADPSDRLDLCFGAGS
jgi:putative FmdB family regulatory protein